MALFFQHKALQRARLELGLTQEQTAETLGVDVRTYRRYESGSVNDTDKGFNVNRAARRQLLSRMGSELGLAVEDLLREPGAGIAPHQPVGHVLAPAPFFVGREKELEALAAWWENDSSSIVCLIAMGGAGKSALAAEFTDSLDENLPQATWSFYEEPQVEGLLRALLRFNALPARAAPLAALEELLGALPHVPEQLWILDGLEVLQITDETGPRGKLIEPLLRRLLTAVLAHSTRIRVMLTSRAAPIELAPWQDKGLSVLPVDGLDDAAQTSLLEAYGIRSNAQLRENKLAPLGGHALSLATVASVTRSLHKGELQNLRDWTPEESTTENLLAERLHRLLESYAEGLKPGARKWLSLLSVLPQGADAKILLELAAQLEPDSVLPRANEVTRDLYRLEAQGLVHRNSDSMSRFSCHPFVAGTFKRLLGSQGRAVHEAQCTRLQSRLTGSPHTRLEGKQLDWMEEWISHAILSGNLARAFSLYQSNAGGFRHLGLERGEMARGVRLMRGFFPGRDPEAAVALSPNERALLLYDWALYSSATGDTDEALRCLDVYETLARRHPRWATTEARTRGYLLWLRGEHDKALESVNVSLTLAQGERDHLARGYALLGAIHQDKGQTQHSIHSFEKAKSFEPKLTLRRAIWEAEALCERQQFNEARTLMENNLETCERLGWAGHSSHCRVVLGRSWAAENTDIAEKHLAAAWPWAHQSGEIEAQLRCYELELQLTDDDDLRRRALARSRETKMRRFSQRFAT